MDDNNPDNAPTDNDATREFKIELAKLVDKAGAGAFTMGAGPTHVSEAKRLIEAERNKLEVLIETEQLEEQQKTIWRNVQEILLTRVFNADNNADFGMRLPEKVYRSDDDFESDKALGWIDDILWALDSASNLESALDKDENGLFVQYPRDSDGKELAFVTKDAAADIYKQPEIQVRGSFGMTDFTRFGVWRVRRYRNAIRSLGGDTGQDTGGNQWVHGESDAFAYSPLDATTIRSLAAANYPSGGQSTYEGSTVAYVGRFDKNAGLAAFQGDVAVNVNWTAPASQPNPGTLQLGTMTAVISNFEKADTGDPLTNQSGTDTVRELIFSAGSREGIPVMTNEDDQVVFNPTTVRVTLGYANRSVSTVVTGGTATIDGAFVGNSSDGPLGVLGRYSIENANLSYEHSPTDQ